MKIFCLGLHKTGTTSLQEALEATGFKVASFFGIDDPDFEVNGRHKALAKTADYDAFQDDPWYIFYRDFHIMYPNARFILLTRESNSWYRSCLKHFGGHTNYVREYFYGRGNGDPVGKRNLWIERKEKHEKEVLNYFDDFPSSFLKMNITMGDGWEKLGPFLGISNCPDTFPNSNRSFDRSHQKLYCLIEKSSGITKFILRLYLAAKWRLNKLSEWYLKGLTEPKNNRSRKKP